MINLLERLSDRLLGMVVPRTAAAACQTYEYALCERCSFPSGMRGRRTYVLTCTCGGSCRRSRTGTCYIGSC